MLEWVVTPSSRGSAQPRDRTCISCISCIGRRIFYLWAPWEACVCHFSKQSAQNKPHTKNAYFGILHPATLWGLTLVPFGQWNCGCGLKSEVTQSCPTLCNPMHCSTPGSCTHGILQVRILEWVAIPSSRGPRLLFLKHLSQMRGCSVVILTHLSSQAYWWHSIYFLLDT